MEKHYYKLITFTLVATILHLIIIIIFNTLNLRKIIGLEYLMYLFIMWTPYISVKLIYHFKLVKGEGKSIKSDWNKVKLKQLLIIPVLGIIIFSVYFSLLSVANSIFGVNSYADFSNNHLKSFIMSKVQESNSSFNINLVKINGIELIGIILSFGLLAAVTVNLLFAYGEEYLWRGVMIPILNKNKTTSIIKQSIIIGILWGLWHFPSIYLLNHNYTNIKSGLFLMIIVSISLSLIMNFLYKKFNNSFIPAVFHGYLNSFASIFSMLVINYTDNIVGIQGILGSLTFIFSFIIVYFFHKSITFIKN